MATTSIWAVKGWLGKVVIYVENPKKTRNPACFEKQGMTTEQAQGLSDVIDYAAQFVKTQIRDERTDLLKHFVSGINCNPETARDEMMAVKKHFGKTDGVVAYHGYQSFAPGEANPEMAHEIGVKLAKKLWGDRFQVLVTTHLDKVNHLHCHFVLNNVSFVDGKKYYRSAKDYYNMQKESDALCREYGLSVIEHPERGKSKHYSEWKADKGGQQTWRGLVKADVDTAISRSMTESQFWDNLRKMGYEIKNGKDISLRPQGKERFVRLRRNFGDEYSIEAIRRRILTQKKPQRSTTPATPIPKKARLIGALHKAKRMTGLRALYFYYLYRIGALPKKREPNPKRIYFLFREDIRYMRNISREARLLTERRIDTAEQLTACKEAAGAQIVSLSAQRKRLHNRARSVSDNDELIAIKAEISALSNQISELRLEVKLCENISNRSEDMTEKLRRAREDEKSALKDVKKDEPFRRRR